jgi:nucleoside-diphosphate-sugar epimerase
VRVFLAGASGVVGRSLLGLLSDAGHEVVGMTRSPQRAEEIRSRGSEAVLCNVFDLDALRSAITEAQPDAVIHELTDLPARLDPRKYGKQLAGTNRIRREGTANLVAAARDAGVSRLLAQSVAFAYAPAGDWVKGEDAPLALDAPAAMGEAVAAVAELERQVLEFGGIVLRYGFFYGPGTAFASDGFYAELARKRRLPVIGGGEGRNSFIHVEDAARATVAALERGSAGVYNIVDDDPAPAREWVPAYATAIGAGPPRHLPAWIARLVAGSVAVTGMTAQRGASNAKAKRELGWSPEHPSWRDGFRTAAG